MKRKYSLTLTKRNIELLNTALSIAWSDYTGIPNVRTAITKLQDEISKQVGTQNELSRKDQENIQGTQKVDILKCCATCKEYQYYSSNCHMCADYSKWSSNER